MPAINVILRDGPTVTVQAKLGASLMEAIRRGGVDEIVALCGGSCSCATCHVYVEAGGERLPEMGPEEMGMLEFSLHGAANSRLSCQLPVDEAMEGLVVRIAPEE